VVTGRREEAARRDEILCSLALQLPETERDSPIALARWLKRLQERHFGGLSTWIPDSGERQAFEYWVKESSEGNLTKRIQRAFRAEQAKKAVKPPAPTLPPLVWPLGMRQRKDRDPKFKLPWLYPDSGGSDKLFLECLADGALHEVSVTLKGQRVGFAPALRPGTFIEIEWPRNSEVKKIATWNGWRERILAQPSNRDALATLKGFPNKDSPVAELAQSLTKFAESNVAEVEKVMPRDFEVWKQTVHNFPLSVTYRFDNGNAAGGLVGTLSLDMERLWFRFRDERGNPTPIR
jgi:hypothetical protein